jgi:neutral ceramidase
MSTLRVTTASVSLGDDNMEQLGSTEAIFPQGVEGEMRVTALVLQADVRVCFVSCDCLVVTAAMAHEAAERIAAAGWVPRDNILICPTHTHSAYATCDVLGLVSHKEFVRRITEGAVLAVEAAVAKLEDPQALAPDLDAELLLGMAQEATVGRNSRLLLKDGSIGWWGYDEEDVVRPTGPFDPDIPILAFRRPSGKFAGIMYNRAAHNIGALKQGIISPAVYGLVAQELEKRHGASTLYFPGALGSSHNITYTGSGVPTDEAMVRLLDAVERGLEGAKAGLYGPVRSLRRPFTYTIREFGEAVEAAKVERYSRRYLGDSAEGNMRVMVGQRAELAPHQGEERQAWLQVIQLGEVAIVGVPCELFARLGIAIRQQSPFRHTFVYGLANDDFGYVGDREGLELGGYQMWVGPHCSSAPGTGEAMVEQAVAMLEELWGEDLPPVVEPPVLRELQATDAVALQKCYNGMGEQARYWFSPLGWNCTVSQCEEVCAEAARGERYDIVLDNGREIVGWAFLQHLDKPSAYLGIGITDSYCGKGLGKVLIQALEDYAKSHGYEGMDLIVLQNNPRAKTLYERFGFEVTEPFTSPDGREFFKMIVKW